MAVYGIAVTAFINLPEAVATARDRLVLKRLRGTPLALWQYLAGSTGAAILIGLATAGLVFGAAIAFFEVQVDVGGLVPALGVALLGTLTFAACGYALVAIAPSTRAVTAIGPGAAAATHVLLRHLPRGRRPGLDGQHRRAVPTAAVRPRDGFGAGPGRRHTALDEPGGHGRLADRRGARRGAVLPLGAGALNVEPARSGTVAGRRRSPL